MSTTNGFRSLALRMSDEKEAEVEKKVPTSGTFYDDEVRQPDRSSPMLFIDCLGLIDAMCALSAL